MKIGILALQGSFIEHYNCLKNFNVDLVLVRNKEDLSDLDGIVLPGGESTTMKNLLVSFDILDELKNRLNNGLYCLATCAGMILLAKEIENEEAHLKVLNVKVKRNAFGSQLNSFSCFENIFLDDKSIKIPMVFIRAPYVVACGDEVSILAKHDDKIVAVKNKNILALAFHPELTNDLTIYKYFLSLIKKKD